MVIRPEKMSWLELQVKCEASIKTSKSQGDVVPDSPRTRKLFKQDNFLKGLTLRQLSIEYMTSNAVCLCLSSLSNEYIYIYSTHIMYTRTHPRS